jgi:aromatic-L-amino-acid decarboxylase
LIEGKNSIVVMQNLIKQLEELEQLSKSLEPSTKLLQEWNEKVINYGTDFVQSLGEGNAYEHYGGEELNFLDFGAKGESIDTILEYVKETVDKFGINPASGGHLGYIPGGGLYSSALGDYLAAVSNRYAGVFYANPGAVKMENDLILWMAQEMGYPSSSGGNLSSGGSIANLIAVTTARDYLGIEGSKVETAVVYMTEQVHHCVHKALRIAGLGKTIWRSIPMDESYKMDMEALERTMAEDVLEGKQPFMIFASAGTTDVGAVDPLDKIADLAERYKCWFHVDGAYGAAFKLVDDFQQLFKGIERSDSLVIDPHKGLFIAYGSGIVLIKNVDAMAQSHYYNANYMQDAKLNASKQWSPADLSPELTKHYRGMRMWLSFKLFGLDAIRASIAEKHLLAKYFWLKMKENGFELGPEPELSVVIYRYHPEHGDIDLFNRKLMESVLADGYNFISSTTINGEFWLRLAVLSFRTHRDRIDYLIDTLTKTKEELLNG